MVISELMKALEHVKKEHGDIPVSITTSHHGDVHSSVLEYIEVDTTITDNKTGIEKAAVDLRDFPY